MVVGCGLLKLLALHSCAYFMLWDVFAADRISYLHKIFMFLFLTFLLLHLAVRRLESWHANVFRLPPSQLSSSLLPYILFHQVSPSQLWSASISLSIYCHLWYISCGLVVIPPLHMSKPSQHFLSEEFCHHDLVLSFILPTPTCAIWKSLLGYNLLSFPAMILDFDVFYHPFPL